MPALLNIMSSRPKRSTAAATAASVSARRVTSQRTKAAWPPLSLIRSAVACSRSSSKPFASGFSSTSATTTDAPSWAKSRAAARPNPDAAPVITATLSRSRMSDLRVHVGQQVLAEPGQLHADRDVETLDVRVEVTAGQDDQPLRFAGRLVAVQGDPGRGQHVVLRDAHQQRRRGDQPDVGA